MQTVHSLVSGATQVKEEVDTLQNVESLPDGDSFIKIMQVGHSFFTSLIPETELDSTLQQFLRHASPAMNALSTLGKTLDDELKTLVLYFGEDPSQMKPEELFDLVAQFSSSLLVRPHLLRRVTLKTTHLID